MVSFLGQNLDLLQSFQESIASCHYKMDQFELSIESYNKAFVLIEKCQMDSNIKCIKKAGIKHNIGLIFKEMSYIEKAINSYMDAVKINEDRQDSVLKDVDIARTLNNIGDCYLDFDEIQKALAEFEKARVLLQDHKEDKDTSMVLAMLLNNEGVCSQRLGNLTSALISYDKSLTVKKEFGALPTEIACTLDNIANIYSIKGDHLMALNKHMESLELKQGKIRTTKVNCITKF